MITFKKILAYPTKPEQGDTYTYLCDLTMQRLDPSSLQVGGLPCEADVVFHSALRRCVECLHLNTQQSYIATSLLNEVLFDLSKLCTRSEWEQEKSIIVRRRLKAAFTHDLLLQSRSELAQELRTILINIYAQAEHQSVTVVSHSFRLKFLEAYIGTHGAVMAHPELIEAYIPDGVKTFGWGEGFIIDRSHLDWLALG